MTVFDLQNRRLVKNLAHKKPLQGLVELGKIIALHPELAPQSFVIGDVAILSLDGRIARTKSIDGRNSCLSQATPHR
jgi:hypothetical protein